MDINQKIIFISAQLPFITRYVKNGLSINRHPNDVVLKIFTDEIKFSITFKPNGQYEISNRTEMILNRVIDYIYDTFTE